MIPNAHTDDAAARERIRHSLGESLIVEASAGTGKTTELITRIVHVLAAGTPVHKIVAVTFTHKAAGELKIRLRQDLDRARAAASGAAECRYLEDALERLEEAAIGTIHGFCAQILHERPVEARIDPAFQELTEPEADRLRDRAFDLWFPAQLDAGGAALRRALARLAWRDHRRDQAEYPPVAALKAAAKQLVEWRDHDVPWARPLFDRAARMEALLGQCRALAALAAQCTRSGDNLVRSLRPVTDLVSQPCDTDTLEARLLKLGRDLKRNLNKGSGSFAPGIGRQQVLDAREALLRDLDAFRRDADADFAAALSHEMRDLVRTYEDLKQRAGRLDFQDLLLLTRDLVRDRAEVRHYLQERYDRIFVDEFQDTEPLQAEILLLLSASDPTQNDWLRATPRPGKLFVVGDPKQSIYKFRRADVSLYEDLCGALESRGVARIHLTRSFRAVRPIQQLVNAAFAPEMTGDRQAGQAHYAPLEEYTPAYPGQPPVVVLPAPTPYGMQRVSNERIDACLPKAVANFIGWLIQSSWLVRDRAGGRVPLRAQHICVLFRRFVTWGQDISSRYTQELEARGIPHLLVGSKSFYQREEVEAIRVALAAIEWPDDELSVFGALRGPLFAIPDDLLLRYRLEGERRRLHPYAKVPPGFEAIQEALLVLRDLHRGRNHRPVAGTINDLLEKTRAHAGFMLRRAGSQALANVYRIGDLARTFELTGGLSFRGFVEELAAQAEKADSMEAPVLEEAADGVRLMTVHSAKGLEFPVVILADMTAKLAREAAERFVSGKLCASRLLGAAPCELLENEAQERARETAEGVRVAYVAATRARDLLVIPAVGDEERSGWLDPLNKAIYPPRDQRRAQVTSPGCPPFAGDCTVLERPPEQLSQPEDSVRPGLHTPQSGEHRVIWWDPLPLRVEVAPGFGLQQEDILASEPAARAAQGSQRYREWQEARAGVLQAGQSPQFRIVSPTVDMPDPPERRPVLIESVAGATDRAGGALFGTLVHAILRDLDLGGRRAQIAAIARAHARLLHALDHETAAIAAVDAAWSHPLLDRARAAPRCHREFPIHLRLDDGRLLEGVVDLTFLEQEHWVVVDFKTEARRQSRHERQLQWYLFAIQQQTGRESRGHLLYL
ncbi:MAG TPA: UvrD-helicase domain-containing protein [Bryobacteraceae bacterium]|nr:UvrD-helicase domain-containing protein [Bryobacteraceae bacterium]